MMQPLRVALAAALMLFPLSALAFDDPKALVQAVYDSYQPGRTGDGHGHYSDALREKVAHFLAGVQARGGDEGGRFDPLVNGQNHLLHDLSIGEPMVSGDTASVPVRFFNFDQDNLMVLALVRQADGWRIDDIAAMGPGDRWLYSMLISDENWLAN